MNTVLRAIFTAIMSVLLVGFGLCGAYGAFAGFSSLSSRNASWGVFLLVAGAIGLGIAWVCWKAIAGIWRKPGPPAE